jgi:hypothetical protein
LQVHQQVAGRLGNPLACRVGGEAEDVYPACVYLDHEERVDPAQQHGVDVEEIAGRQSRRLAFQEFVPGGAVASWCRAEPGCGQDPPDRALAYPVSQTQELAWIRRYPQRGFCLASRVTSSRISSGTGGRPGLLGSADVAR